MHPVALDFSGGGPGSLRQEAARYLARTLGLSDADVQELLQVGAANVRTCLQGARGAGSLAEIARRAHALKGNLVNMGLADAAGRAKELERAAQGGRSGQAEELLRGLEFELQSLWP